MTGSRLLFLGVALLLLVGLLSDLDAPVETSETTLSPARLSRQPSGTAGAPDKALGPNGPIAADHLEETALDCLNAYSRVTCLSPGETLAGPLDEALDLLRGGELLGAIKLYEMLIHCIRYPRTEQAFAYRLASGWALPVESFSYFSESALVQGREQEPYHQEQHALYVAYYTERLLRCAPVHGLVEGGFRSTVAELAVAGNEAAQLLYSLWQPRDGTTFEAFVDWQITAEGYAQEGLRQRRPLGVVAYSYGYFGIFVPYHFMTAWSFARAAMACGIDKQLIPSAFTTIDPDEETDQFVHGLFAQQGRDEWTEQFTASCMPRATDDLGRSAER